MAHDARHSDAATDEQRLLSLYSALIACDQAVIRSSSRSALFDVVCQHLVQQGAMDFAWIGMLDPGDSTLWPQAQFGRASPMPDLLPTAHRAADHQQPAAATRSLCESLPVWSDDIACDARVADIAPLAAAQGWRSVARLALGTEGHCIGVLTVYARHAHAFGDTARSLLMQLASNIGYALGHFDQDAQRQQAQADLKESEARYSALFVDNCLPMLVMDPDGARIVDANKQALRFYGWDYATFTRMHAMDINALSAEQIRQEMRSAVDRKKSHFDFRHRVASGEVRDVEVFSSPIVVGGQTYLISAIHDVTERRRLEVQVRNAQSLMQRFVDHLPGPAFIKDSALRLRMANLQLGQLLGTDPQSLIGKTAHDLFPPDFADYVTRIDRDMLAQGGSRVYAEAFEDRHNETSMFVIDDESGQRLLGGLSFDVTDRFHASERSSALLRINELGDQLPETAFMTAGLELVEQLTHSKIGFLHLVNDDQETLELVTWTALALQGCTAAYDSHYPASQAGIWADCLGTRKAAIFNDYPGYADKRGLPNGHAALRRLACVPVMEGGLVRMLVGVGNKESEYSDFDTETMLLLGNDMWRIVRRSRVELTLKQRVQELVDANQKLSDMQLQLLQSEKMASIGQLASGVAHEINNPIGFVKSNLGSLATYVDKLLEIVRSYEAAEQALGAPMAHAFASVRQRKDDLDYAFLVEDLAKLIEESVDGIRRVSGIVLDLKNFSRSGDGAMDWADLRAGIESTINVVWNQLKYKAELHREYAQLPLVRCMASQINQVVMNLLVNAGQAIGERGQITVRTGIDGARVWFEVQDDGCGISLQDQARIFEPFFTSKPVGQGTGLGLSISFGIVQRHHGAITVQSSPGQGSTFRVTLPVDAAEAAAP